jgi:hypothetical protein
MKLSFYCFKNLLFAFTLISIFSCSSENTEEASTNSQDSAAILVNDTSSPAQDFFYSLPSPMVMVKVFKRSGLKYVDGIANSPNNVSKYSSTETKTLNLGVYSADLAYAVINKQSQQASKYMEAVKKLSDDLGMSSLFDSDDFVKRFKDNLNNEDSLIAIVAALKSEMDIFMKDNEKEKQSLFIFIGAWVENLYLATQLTKDADKEKVAMRIAEQKFVLNSLMNVITNYQNEAEFNDLYLKLNELKSLFDNLSVQGDEERPVMDELNLKAITEKTSIIRKQITQ